MKCERIRSTGLALAAAALAATAATAATFGDLAGGRGAAPAYAPSGYGPVPYPSGGRGAGGYGGYRPAAYARPDASCPQCPGAFPPATPQGAPPPPLDAPAAAQTPPGGWTPPDAYLPFGRETGLPNQRLQVWTFGQANSTTDPFNTAGLSTPFMFVPWSTPLSAWTNAQTWNWWRERAGVQPPYW